MKRNLFLLTLMMLFSFTASAQDSLTVTLEKPGQLAKVIGKNPSQLKKLIILADRRAMMNEKDFKALAQCTNLTSLQFGNDVNSRLHGLPDLNQLPQMPSVKELDIQSKDVLEIGANFPFPNLESLYVTDFRVYLKYLSEYKIKNLGVYLSEEQIKHLITFTSSYKEEERAAFNHLRKISQDVSYERKGGPIKPKCLIVASKYLLVGDELSKRFDPNFIWCANDNLLILNRWEDSLDKSLIEKIDSLGNGAFAGSNISEITLPDKVKVIPRFCFRDCKNLTSVVANGITEIRDYAFENTPLQELSLPSTINRLGEKAFEHSNVGTVKFLGNYAPELYGTNYYGNLTETTTTWFESNVQFIVPKGRLQAFNIGAWKRANVKEVGAQSRYTFEVKKPGTLETMLTDAIAPKVESLTIKGLLYDTDLAAISKCKNLRDLDLGHSFICWSPATIKQKMSQKEFEMAYVAAVARTGQADEAARAKAGRGSVAVSEYMGMVAKDFEKAAKYYSDPKNFKGSDDCVLPGDDINKLTHLERIVFPAQLKTIRLWLQTKYLKEIVLPPYLERLEHLLSDKGDYKKQDVAAVRNIVFPSTLKYIGDDCFNGFVKLESVDLSNTQVESIGQNAFMYCKNLKTFKGSKFLKEIGYRAFEYIFNPDTGKRSTEGYFYTMEGPNGLFPGEFGKVHVPRGAKAGYRNSSGGTIVDDIEE